MNILRVILCISTILYQSFYVASAQTDSDYVCGDDELDLIVITAKNYLIDDGAVLESANVFGNLCALADTARMVERASPPSGECSANIDLEYCEANLDQAVVYWNQSRDKINNLRICMEEARNISFYPALQDSVAAKLSECIEMAQ